MIEVQVDESVVKNLYLEEIKKRLDEVDHELLFWDTQELKRRTCMSWNTIQKEFFFHPDFPKYKVGGKWYFPAHETKQFLLNWLKEH